MAGNKRASAGLDAFRQIGLVDAVGGAATMADGIGEDLSPHQITHGVDVFGGLHGLIDNDLAVPIQLHARNGLERDRVGFLTNGQNHNRVGGDGEFTVGDVLYRESSAAITLGGLYGCE